jgi:hypothetical protein
VDYKNLMGWSAITYASYNSSKESIFALNGTYRKRIQDEYVYEWGLAAPTDPNLPTIAVGTSTGLTGDYNAKYTFCRKERDAIVCESNPSIAADAAVTLANESLKIVASEPPDRQINAIRFYRTAADGSTYSLDTTLYYANGDYGCVHDWEEDGEYITGRAYRFTIENDIDDSEDCFAWEVVRNAYTLTDNLKRITCAGDNIFYYDSAYQTTPGIDTDTADTALGTEVSTDHDRPPAGFFVAGPSFNGTCFIIKDNRLYFSKVKQPEYWPTTYYVDIGPISRGPKAVVFFNKQPYALTPDAIYYIYGTTYSDFLPMKISSKTGAVSQNGAVGIEGHGIFHVGNDGLYRCLPSTDSRQGMDEKISRSLDPIFRGETKNGVLGAGDLTNSWLTYFKNQLYFGYPSTVDTYPKQALVFHLENGNVSYYSWPHEIHHLAVDYTNDRLFGVDSRNYVWIIDNPDYTDDDGDAISWEVETKEYTLPTRKHFPRWVKYDVDASGASTVTGSLLLDGVSKQTHTLSSDRDTRRRLVETCNGNRCSLKITGTGAIEIYMMESE